MNELVNDLGRPISAPCPPGLFFDLCREPDYKSWRKLAIMIRRCLLEADWSIEGTKDLHAVVLSWLKSWIDPAEIDSPVSLAVEYIRAQQDADPDVPEGGRFPDDLAFWSGEYHPSGPVYNSKTQELLTYIKSGKKIFDRARKAGAIRKESSCAKEIEISEEIEGPPPRWIKPAVFVVGGLGILGFGVWAYTKILGALAGRGATGAN